MLEVQGRLSKKIPLPHVVFRLRPAIIVCKEEKSKGIILCKKPSCVEKSMSIALQALQLSRAGSVLRLNADGSLVVMPFQPLRAWASLPSPGGTSSTPSTLTVRSTACPLLSGAGFSCRIIL